MVVPFKDNRRILAGWFQNDVRWGGVLVFRELVQHGDGTLGMKWPAEMIPDCSNPLPLHLAGGPGVTGDAKELHVTSNRFAFATLTGMSPDIRITLRVEPSPDTEAFGLNLLGFGDYEGGCELQFMPKKKQVQWGIPHSGLPAFPVPSFASIVAEGPYLPMEDRFATHYNLKHFPFKGDDFAISGVEGLDRAFTLDLIVKREKNGGCLIDACIDNRRTMITGRKKLTGDKIFFFVRDGSVTFSETTIRPLVLQ